MRRWWRNSANRAIERYWRGEQDRSLDSGAGIEKKPGRQIAEWGAKFESVEQAVPGTGRGVASGPTGEKDVSDSPEREADLDKAYESMDLEMEM